MNELDNKSKDFRVEPSSGRGERLRLIAPISFIVVIALAGAGLATKHLRSDTANDRDAAVAALSAPIEKESFALPQQDVRFTVDEMQIAKTALLQAKNDLTPAISDGLKLPDLETKESKSVEIKMTTMAIPSEGSNMQDTAADPQKNYQANKQAETPPTLVGALDEAQQVSATPLHSLRVTGDRVRKRPQSPGGQAMGRAHTYRVERAPKLNADVLVTGSLLRQKQAAATQNRRAYSRNAQVNNKLILPSTLAPNL